MIPSENVIVNPGQVMRVIPSAQDRPAAGEGEGGGVAETEKRLTSSVTPHKMITL